LKEINVDESNFYCKFVQNVNKDSNDLLKPDLSKPYHLLVVRGSASDKTGNITIKYLTSICSSGIS
jgi:hypothetical protein